MDAPIVLAKGIEVSPDEISVEYSRSSGPGGQHVNKTETRVTLRFAIAATPSIPDEDKARMIARLASRVTKLGELLVSCDSHRDRSRNMEEAYERLGDLLRRAFEKPKPRKKTRPSRGAKERRLEEKRRTQGKKAGRRAPKDDG